jgi:hypothetical protein
MSSTGTRFICINVGIGPAVEVAGAFQAHLVGLSITPPIVIVPAACVAPMSHAAGDIGAH